MAEFWHRATFAVMVAGWVGFSLGFVGRRRHFARAARRDGWSLLGIALQMAGFSVAWRMERHPAEAPFLGHGIVWQVAFFVLTAILSAWSAWAMFGAVRALGKQWSLQARVLPDHELVTSGPFERVRHPIYSAMNAMLVASALAIGTWEGLALGLTLELAGTWLRTRGEEKLLRGVFGARYDEYAARVPALVPRLPW